MVKFLLGADPELMLRHKTSGQLVSAIPIIKEGKGAGRPLDKGGQNCVLHDNTLVEFNTAPAANEEEFVTTLDFVLKAIQQTLPEPLELHLQSSADYPASELEDPQARAFGCEPDYNAWLLAMNEVPAGAADRPFRSAGGHIHIGMTTGKTDLNRILDDDYGKVDVVKALDIFPGLISVFLDPDPTAAARRALYGGAGAHRPKPYGVEYRALGNWWLRSPRYARLVYKLTAVALDVLVEGHLPKLINEIGEEKIQAVINDSDKRQARQLYKKHLVKFLPGEVGLEIQALYSTKPEDFRAAWALAA